MTTWGPERIQAEVDRIKKAERAGRTFRFLNDGMFFSVDDKSGIIEPRRAFKYEEAGNKVLFEKMVAALRAKNFWMAHDREVKKRHHCILEKYWMGAHRGSKLRVRGEYFPTGLRFEFYPDCNSRHSSGPRYAFSGDRIAAIDFWSRMALGIAVRELRRVAAEAGLVDVSKPVLEDPRDRVEWDCRDCWHFKGEASIDVPRKTEHYNDTNRNGRRIRNGELQGHRDRRGRMWIGKVYARLNNTWTMICGGDLKWTSTGEMFDPVPGLARKAPTVDVKSFAERHLKKAIEAQDFERCAAIRDHIKAMGIP